jgi:hypothetical protein
VSYEEPLIQAVLKELDELEDSTPGKFVSFKNLLTTVEAFNPDQFEFDDMELAYALEQLIERDWAESNGEGFELPEQSFRITAKGQIRSSSSVDFAAQFGKMLNDLPTLDEAPTGVDPDLQPQVHQLTARDVVTGPPEATHPTFGVFQRVEPTASTTPTFSQSRAGIDFAEPAGPITQVIDSAAWTGTQFVLIDAHKIAEVRRAANELRDAVRLIHFESNSDSVNLHCLVEALVSICEMAEPEGTIVDRILASPKFKTYASLAGIIATIRGAFGI